MKLLKIPLNAGGLSKRKGIEKGPETIVSFLDDFYMNEAGLMPLFELEELKIDNSNLEAAHSAIYESVDKLGKNHPFTILIGGDHSMTYPAFKAYAKNNPGAGLVVFDAHPDCQENHHPPTHEDYLRVLIDERILDPDRVIIIGARNMSKEERKFIDYERIKNYSMKEISFDGLREVTDSIMSVARQWPKVYLSIDIDVLDPASAPGTGYAEPGGLTAREIIYMVQRLKLMRNIGAADIVEVNPEKDLNGMTSKLAAKLVVELN
jgi:arginase family enzyme